MAYRNTAIIFNGDHGQGSRRVTRKELVGSGTLLWGKELDDGSEISFFDHKGGFALFTRFDGHYATEKVGAAAIERMQSDEKELKTLVRKLAARVAQNREDAMSRSERESSKTERGVDFLDTLADKNLPFEPDFAEGIVFRESLRHDLQEALSDLSATQRGDWLRHHCAGMTLAEIAAARGVTESAVSRSVSKATRKIAERLRALGWD